MSMNNNNEEANVIVVKETLKQQLSDDKEIIEDDTKANLKGNNDAPRNIAEPPDARKATTATLEQRMKLHIRIMSLRRRD